MKVLVCYLVSATIAVLAIALIHKKAIKNYFWFYILAIVAPIEYMRLLFNKEDKLSRTTLFLMKKAMNSDGVQINKRITMTPKEKAIELIDKYKWISYDLDDIENHKESALIAVDEIIEAIDWHKFDTPNEEFQFWQEVKQEIEKL